MLPSPPLTAGSSSPHPSLKRTWSDATDDAYTPPITPPPSKRRRCPSSASSPAIQHNILGVSTFSFDPSNLKTPPEYTHVPYDPEFGRKVCRQYRKSLIVQRACDAVSTAARKQKYGERAALAHSPGSTPDHIRRSYEDEQRRLDEAAAEIIANSESEFEPAHEPEASGESGSKLVNDLRVKFMARNTTSMQAHPLQISRDETCPQLKHVQPGGKAAQQQYPVTAPSDSGRSTQLQQHRDGVSNCFRKSIDASCEARAQSAYRISSLRRKYRLREQHRSFLMVGS